MLSKMETAVFRKFKADGLPAKVRDLLYLGGGVEAKACGLERTPLHARTKPVQRAPDPSPYIIAYNDRSGIM